MTFGKCLLQLYQYASELTWKPRFFTVYKCNAGTPKEDVECQLMPIDLSADIHFSNEELSMLLSWIQEIDEKPNTS